MTHQIPEMLTTEIVGQIIIDESGQLEVIDTKFKSLVARINQTKLNTSKTQMREIRSLSNQIKSLTEQLKALQDFIHNLNIQLLSYIKQENIRDISLINCQGQINTLYNQIDHLLTSMIVASK